MSERDLREVIANHHRVNDLHNLMGGLANVLNQDDPTRIIHQMARLHRSLIGEVVAIRADLTKLARHIADQDGDEG